MSAEAPSLRPYQERAFEAIRDLYRAGQRRVLAVSPTGSGKTVLFCAVARAAVAKGSRVLVLAHRREIVAQTSDKLTRFGVEHGIVQAGFRPAPQRPVQVASVQTLVRRPGSLEHVDLVVVDEAHHVTGNNTYSKLLGWWPRARVLAVTATPWRLDGRGLADVFPAHVVVTTPRELRDEGWLCPVGGWAYEALDTARARVQRGDYAAKDLAEAARSVSVAGDVVQEWMLHAAGRRTVLFACGVEHSQHMVRLFRAEGVAAEHLDGETPAAERDALLARLRGGETLVVCNCNVLTEGFDCPELEVALLCRPTLSTSLALQMVGRVLRPCPGKDGARIHDHAGVLRAHGHPYSDRDWSPASGAGSADRKEAGAAQRKTCPQCASVLARFPCDACGFAPSVEEQQAQFRMEQARRRAIEEAPSEEEQDLQRRRGRWRREYMNNYAARQRLWLRLLAKHYDLKKAAGVYRWFSGELEWPPRAWRKSA